MTATSRGDVSGVTGGDPRTVHSLTAVGIDVARSMQEEGGDPKTVQHVPSGGEVKNRPFRSLKRRGKNRPSLLLSANSWCVVGKCGFSPIRGGWQPKLAYSSTVSPVLDPVLRLSHGSEVRDAFPSWQEKTVQIDDLTGDPVRFDEFPSTAESRDGLPELSRFSGSYKS